MATYASAYCAAVVANPSANVCERKARIISANTTSPATPMPNAMASAVGFDAVDASMIEFMKASIVDTLPKMVEITP